MDGINAPQRHTALAHCDLPRSNVAFSQKDRRSHLREYSRRLGSHL